MDVRGSAPSSPGSAPSSYNLAATLASLAAGRYTDRTDGTRVLATDVAAFALAYLGFTHDTSSPLALLPWLALAGIGIGCAETAEPSPRSSSASRRRRTGPTDGRGHDQAGRRRAAASATRTTVASSGGAVSR